MINKQSQNFGTIGESSLGYMKGTILCMKKLHLLAKTGVRKNSSVACGFSPTKIHYFEDTKCLINRINEVYVFSIKHCKSNILLKTQ